MPALREETRLQNSLKQGTCNLLPPFLLPETFHEKHVKTHKP